MEIISEERRLRHEVRNCMNSLNLNAACLKLCDPPEAVETLESMIEASTTLIELMDRLDELPEPTSDLGNEPRTK